VTFTCFAANAGPLAQAQGVYPNRPVKLNAAASIDIVHVPYKGTIQAVTDLFDGQIQVVFSDMVPAMPQLHGGKLRARGDHAAARQRAARSADHDRRRLSRP
jgi:tripartite-type tricarboxylate transporter receptor subunit TctC